MRINNNISLAIGRSLQESSSAIARSLERLSTGKRVNSPADDQASFSLIQGLSSQLRGLRQANLNINTGVGLLLTASSALSSQSDILQRMREIAVQGSSSSLSASERNAIGDELTSLLEEFRRISSESEFNGIKLLDGSFSSTALQIGAYSGDELDISINSSQASRVFRRDIGAGTFKTATTHGMGDSPDDATLADVDGDGNLDLITVDDGTSHTISVRLGNGDGTFGARTTVSAGNTPIQIEAADITGDGIVDLIVLDDTSNTIDLYTGKGDGSFEARVTYAVTEASGAGFAVNDFNGDGDLDLAVGNSSTTMTILLNDGVGGFQSGITFSTTGNSDSVLAADYDGDGDIDIAIGDAVSGNIEILFNQGDGSSFTNGGLITPIGIFAGSATFTQGDFNDDGYMDIIVNDAGSANIDIRMNTGAGSFTGSSFSTGTTSSWYEVGDFNNDGNLDLLGTSGIAWALLRGNGVGSFTAGATGSLTSSGVASVGDLNNDGILDFITPNLGSDLVSVLIQNSSNVTAEAEVDVSSAEKAQALIAIIDEAHQQIVDQEVELSIIVSRLENIQSYNLVQSENLAEAKSLAEEADIALETSELVRNQILQQAQISSLAQANIQMQFVLGLLI